MSHLKVYNGHTYPYHRYIRRKKPARDPFWYWLSIIVGGLIGALVANHLAPYLQKYVPPIVIPMEK